MLPCEVTTSYATDTVLCFSEAASTESTRRIQHRLFSAFRPKTRQCYIRLFRNFVAFCICSDVKLCCMSVSLVLLFLEFLVKNAVTVCMIQNYVSALRAVSVVYNLRFQVFDHPRVTYFLKALRINRPLAVSKSKNVIDVSTLKNIVSICDEMPHGQVLKAVYLTAFFGFFRLSNLAPHAVHQFDLQRHFTGSDVFFYTHDVKLLLKWSKTLQTRDQVKLISLPRLQIPAICPFRALKAIVKLYNPSGFEPLFQCHTVNGWQPLTDSRVRKSLSKINARLGLHSSYYTFHAFRRSGASLAYQLRVPVPHIKEQGTWTSDCVWRYIHSDGSASLNVAKCFRNALS